MTTSGLFQRTALGRLRDWRQRPDRKPLVVRGARQVGKTVLVRMFAAQFPHYAELNLGRPSHAALFKRALAAKDLLQAILLECNIPSTAEPPLIFLDEIQECPEAVAMLRYLYEDCPAALVLRSPCRYSGNRIS